MQPLTRHHIVEVFAGNDEQLVLPELSAVVWEKLDYLGWIHPEGHLGFIVLLSPGCGTYKGVRLSRNGRGSARAQTEMCSWCHYVHRKNGTAMFTVRVKASQGYHTLSNTICKDLDCSLRVRNLVGDRSQMQETLYEPARIWRMQNAIFKWLGRANQL